MRTTLPRNYACKDEELPVICEYVSFSFKRDITDFTAYSPMFSEDFSSAFSQKIVEASQLVNPIIDTAERKAVTAHLYAAMNALIDPLNRLEGYLKLANGAIPVSSADFGISPLRKKIYNRDSEGVLRNLRLVIENIDAYSSQLAAVGFQQELSDCLADAVSAIDTDNKMQYELLARRKELVQANLQVFNDLYAQMMVICNTGKIIYKNSSPEKVQEYTFKYLVSKVRTVYRSANGKRIAPNLD